MAGHVPVATVLGRNPVSHRSCAVLVRGRSPSDTRIRGRNIHRLLFRRSKHCKQVRQSTQQRNKRKFKLGWNFRAVTAHYHQQWISSRDPGRSGGEGGGAGDDEELNTTNKGLDSKST